MSTNVQEQSAPDLSARSVGGLLDETVTIYFRHFWRFAKLAALVHLPAGIVSVLFLEMLREPEVVDAPALVLEAFVGTFGAVFLYGAAVTAVGQHYVTGNIGLRSCYRRAWLKVLSLAVIATVAALFALLPPVATFLQDKPSIVGAAIPVLIGAFVLVIYWSLAVQVVVIESYRPVDALRRSTSLIKGSWWRICGFTVIVGLIATGLRVVAMIPFMLIAAAFGVEQTSEAGHRILSLGGVVVGIFVLPVLFIAGTLVYYDVRIRKEQFDLTVLRREMGLAPS